jgi:uncharacterized protein YbaR (Trm112 family)
MSASVLDSVVCPECRAPMSARPGELRCASCGQVYPRVGSIPVVMPRPKEWLALWRLQLGLLENEGQQKLAALEAELAAPGVLPLTASRCRAMVEGAREEAKDVIRLMDPLLPRDTSAAMSEVSMRAVESPVRRVPHLCRDWGWSEGKHPENDEIFSLVGNVIEGPLGRVLVLGAGACRLAYDLHRTYGPQETVALDVDPLLLVGAREVIRGGTVRITESNVSVHETSNLAPVWNLRAPFGPIGEETFHFLLADGLAPPFVAESFDTVVTPWFIDVVPPDLRDLLGVLRTMLKPGGKWIDVGPLLYPRDRPLYHRFTREEIFELAARAGFRLAKWKTESGIHFASPTNGRGHYEWTLAFQAVKEDVPAESEDVPSWIILAFLPVPTFAGHAEFSHANPLIASILRSLDGRRSIDDIASHLRPEVMRAGLDPSDLREAIRHCLAAFHPGCRRGPLAASPVSP